MTLPNWIHLDTEVENSLAKNQAVVAVESSVWCQGLPQPLNYEVALDVLAQIRRAGAQPAVIWLESGKVQVSANAARLQVLCQEEEILKVGVGDLPGVLATERLGATTVSSTLHVADALGIQVLATGGIGGIHRGWIERPDFSADLGQLSRSRCMTVCSGIKSVIDIPATLEILETLGIPLALYDTDKFPQFYTLGAEINIGFRVNNPAEVVRAQQLSLETLGRGILLNQSVPREYALGQDEMEAWIADGLQKAAVEGHSGKAITPFLLDHVARVSAGRSLEANRALLVQNAWLAAQIAVALCEPATV